MVRASVSAAIEKQDLGKSLKSAGLNTVIETVSGSIAEKIGQAAGAKVNSLSPIEHKLAHFALGAGMGTAMGTAAGHKNVLADAITSSAGAVIGETVAEALADREQLMKEAKAETYVAKGSFDPDYCFALYRQKLQPYVDIGRLTAGAAIAAVGRDPTLAIAAAANALENNFAKSIPLPKIGGIPGVDIVAILQEALAGFDDPP